MYNESQLQGEHRQSRVPEVVEASLCTVHPPLIRKGIGVLERLVARQATAHSADLSDTASDDKRRLPEIEEEYRTRIDSCGFVARNESCSGQYHRTFLATHLIDRFDHFGGNCRWIDGLALE